MYIIANWKQNKTVGDLRYWFEDFNPDLNNLKVVVAASYPLLPALQNYLSENIHLASQDISEFEDGAHTGETGAFQLKDFVQYSIIGHSERRIMGESIESVNNKIEQALKYNIIPIVCFSTVEEFNSLDKTLVQSSKALFAYEPATAISTSENLTGPASLEEVHQMCDQIGLDKVIYGGSVDIDSIPMYLDSEYINGFLVGKASLEPKNFSDIINQIVSRI